MSETIKGYLSVERSPFGSLHRTEKALNSWDQVFNLHAKCNFK